MITPPGRQALLFRAGGLSFALPLRAVREIAPCGPDGDGVSLAGALGLRGAPRFALVPEDGGVPLLVDEMRGVADLGEAEVFRLPARSVAVRPSPFAGALRVREEIHLELAPGRIDVARKAVPKPPPVVEEAPRSDRELVAERGGVAIAVPLALVVQVVDPARLAPVPLAPAGHRGVLYHGRALHPAYDAAALLGEPGKGDPRVLLLLDAGGTTVGVLVDRVRGLGEGDRGQPVRRPPWDALLAPHEEG
jgi:chemotaxis signal transduction protein